MTNAARQFIDELSQVWDHRDCYIRTVEAGYLAEPDAERWEEICDLAEAAGEDLRHADDEVWDYIRAHAAEAPTA